MTDRLSDRPRRVRARLARSVRTRGDGIVGGACAARGPGARRLEGRIDDARGTRSNDQTPAAARLGRQLPQRLRSRGVIRASSCSGGRRVEHGARARSGDGRGVGWGGEECVSARGRSGRAALVAGSRSGHLRSGGGGRAGRGGGGAGGFGADLGFRAGAWARFGRRSVDRRADGGRASLVGAGVVVPGSCGSGGGRRGSRGVGLGRVAWSVGLGTSGVGPLGRRDRIGIFAEARGLGCRRIGVVVRLVGLGGV